MTKSEEAKTYQLTGHAGVCLGSTQLLLSHIFIGDRLHNIWSRDEQVRRVLYTQKNNSGEQYHWDPFQSDVMNDKNTERQFNSMNVVTV